MTDQADRLPTPKGKIRHCWYCGDDMGFIEDRYYDRTDVCGKRECNRALQDMIAEERAERHREVDDDYRW